MFVNMSSVAFVVLSAQYAQPGSTVGFCAQFGKDVAVCHRCEGERNRQLECCQRAQTTHRVATDLGRSAIRKAETAGNVLGVSAASTVGTLHSPRNVECHAKR